MIEEDKYNNRQFLEGRHKKQKGIKLFDVELQKPNIARNFDAFTSIVSGILAGKGLHVASDLAMDKVSKKAKYNALKELYKDDKVMSDRLEHGYYNEKGIDQLFKENVDKIIEKYVD